MPSDSHAERASRESKALRAAPPAQAPSDAHANLRQPLARAHGGLAGAGHCVYMQPLSDLMDITMQPEKSSEHINLHSASRLNDDQLHASAGELGLFQVRHLLLQPDLAAERVAEPGSPAFDYGLTQSDLLMHSLRAAQISQLAA